MKQQKTSEEPRPQTTPQVMARVVEVDATGEPKTWEVEGVKDGRPGVWTWRRFD